ncbi:hypothetical protein DPMN_064302 [Dreissena polymorpha]|uniref:Uncharacterized protein n=1 Tax=Dreissena polymorpha TaxID=45954 RepID=A0A9D4CDE5_DREPO|nr:hypothetical protein DPMN_064302 [Dreissena polymorpha]
MYTPSPTSHALLTSSTPAVSTTVRSSPTATTTASTEKVSLSNDMAKLTTLLREQYKEDMLLKVTLYHLAKNKTEDPTQDKPAKVHCLE